MNGCMAVDGRLGQQNYQNIMQARRLVQKPSSLKEKFKILIDTLRTQTSLKDKIQTREHIQQIMEPAQLDLERQINEIMPITQRKQDTNIGEMIKSILGQQQMNALNSSDLIVNAAQIKENDLQIRQEASIQKQDTHFDKIRQGRNRLNPQKQLQCPFKQGRVGAIRHQAVSVNVNLRLKIMNQQRKVEPRYTKLNEKSEFKCRLVPVQVQRQKVAIKLLDDVEVIKYWNGSSKITQKSTYNQIFSFFQKMIDQLAISINSTIIKKYKNCVYFGQDSATPGIYQGIIYYFQGKIYYGEFLNGIKHGHGVEINFKGDTKYAGIFNAGKKNGYFFVQKHKENYQGTLQYGIYHGQGTLMTEHYSYKGHFQNGKKHGFGEQYYPKTGLKLKGYFCNGNYENINQSRAKVSVSQPLLTNKLEKIMSMAKTQAFNFNIDFKNNGANQSNFPSRQDANHKTNNVNQQAREFPFGEDGKSLYDIITKRERINKYDFYAQKISKQLPKIYLQGIKKKQLCYDDEDGKIINKRQQILYEESRIWHRKNRSNGSKPIIFQSNRQQLAVQDCPLSKQRARNRSWMLHN